MADHATPPGLPDVVDEAADTPSWMPWLGFGLVLGAFLLSMLGGGADREPATAPADTAHHTAGDPPSAPPTGAHE